MERRVKTNLYISIYREGFRLRKSDVDNMLWSNNHSVIMELSLSITTKTIRSCRLSLISKYRKIQSPTARMNDSLFLYTSIKSSMIIILPIRIYGSCSSSVKGPQYINHISQISFDFCSHLPLMGEQDDELNKLIPLYLFCNLNFKMCFVDIWFNRWFSLFC